MDSALPIVMEAPFPAPREREWLITNGLGGYASGSLAGIATRRYHGHFVPNLADPKGRYMMISRLDLEVLIGERRYLVGGADFPEKPGDGDLPWLRMFRLESNVARWTYDFAAAKLERAILMPHLQNTLCVRYHMHGDTPAVLRVRPFTPFRRHDADLDTLATPALSATTDARGCEIVSPSRRLQLRLATRPGIARFIDWPEQADGQLLTREQRRGYQCFVTEYSPGYFEFELQPDSTVSLIASTDDWSATDIDVEELFEAERRRLCGLVSRLQTPREEFSNRLVVAADQFLIQPESRIGEKALAAAEGHQLRTVIAGYHWFGDWGRDTMIALEGLMLCTGRHQEARATLLTFAHYVRDGLLPNLFPEGAQEGLYHTVDASLWYFHAIQRYVRASGDKEILEELLPTLRSIVDHHLQGTRHGIRADTDGLIHAGTPHHALTWMDAHMGDWIVTPRRGKPVEIQALWYNALRLMSVWQAAAGELAREYEELATRVRDSFNRRYWNEQRGCLYDVVDGETGDDARLRPNQIFAISLDHPVLAAARWQPVIDTVTRHLLTPVGLRTLDAADPDYRSTYHGDLKTRDAAYHQGTVWPWLLGHFIDAWVRVYGDRLQARELLQAFPHHLTEAGLGSISEVFDADWPHTPHGCIAQAWSVAEILRAWQATATRSVVPGLPYET